MAKYHFLISAGLAVKNYLLFFLFVKQNIIRDRICTLLSKTGQQTLSAFFLKSSQKDKNFDRVLWGMSTVRFSSVAILSLICIQSFIVPIPHAQAAASTPSPILDSASGQEFDICLADVITTLTIREKEGVTTQNYPLTFAHIFIQGEVTNSVAVCVNGQVLPTQFDIKTRFDDNSVRHGVISATLPGIKANQDLQIKIISTTSNANTGEMSKSDIVATGVKSQIRLTNIDGSGYSGTLTADLNQIINDSNNIDYWLSGSVVTEILINQKLNNSLNATWEVRFYPGWDGIRISNAMENVEGNYRGNIDYAVDIQMGDNSNPLSSYYSKSTFQHNHNARWRKVLWIGNEPPEVEVRYDVHYLIDSGHVLNYAVDEFEVPESTIAGSYSNWLSNDHDIMETSYITTYFPTTGGREEIGVLPRWTIRYLFSMDNRMREIMLNHAELFSGAPIHYRESDPNRSFHGHIISIDDRPTVWLGREDYQWQDDADILPDPIGSEDTVWSIDRAHQASFVYIPYLITGEKYYLDELYYWAGFNLAKSNYNSDYGRDYARGLVRDQIRGEAWAMRNIADAAALAPDGDMEKAYLEEKIENNINEWLNEQTEDEEGNRYPFNAWGINTSGRNNGEFENAEKETDIYGTTSGWMEDWMLLILTHMKELGYSTKPIIDKFHKFVINRFSHPDFNWYNGASYHFPLQYTVDRVPKIQSERKPGEYLQTWKEANDAYVEQPVSFPDGDYPYSYRYKALAALACVTDYTVEQHSNDGAVSYASGVETYEWLRDRLNSRDKFNDNPTWAIVPRATTVDPLCGNNICEPGEDTSCPEDCSIDVNGDANLDGIVDILDIIACVNHIIETKALDGQGYKNANMNSDTAIDILDLISIINIVLED